VGFAAKSSTPRPSGPTIVTHYAQPLMPMNPFAPLAVVVETNGDSPNWEYQVSMDLYGLQPTVY
jgi:hypothetical protein